jgi:uncharacterized protein (TIRG00374 family)
MMPRRRVALGLVGLGISVASIALLTQLVDVRRSLEILLQADLLPLLFALGVIAAELVLRSARWALLLRQDDSGRPAIRRVVPVLLIGYLGNVLLPARLGEVVRAYLISRRETIALSVALGTVFLERVMDLASLAAVAFVAAMLADAPAWIVTGTGVAASIGLVVMVVLVVVRPSRIVEYAMRHLGPGSRRFAAIARAIIKFGDGAGAQSRSTITQALALSVLCWLLDATTFWLVGHSLHVDLTWPAALIIAAVTVLGTAIPSAPGYIGTFELAAVASARAMGVPAEASLALAVLTHIITTVPLALGGAVSLSHMSLTWDKLAAAARQTEAAPATVADP